MTYSASAAFALVGPVIAGHLVTEYHTFLTAQLWPGASLLMSAGCMAFSRYYLEKQRKGELDEKVCSPNMSQVTTEERAD